MCFDPSTIDYVFGYGYSIGDVKNGCALVQQFGRQRCVSIQAEMKQKFLQLL